MSPDDYTSDPTTDADGVPGTVDDLPNDYGQQVPDADESGAARTSDSDAAEDGDESALWQRQRALIEEDEKEGLRLDGFEPEEIPEILDAMGDDAAEPLGDSPNGTSATGLWGTPEHGGFPERTD